MAEEIPGAVPVAVVSEPAPKLKTPSAWSKEKNTPAWILAGAYHARRWERDSAGNDLSLISETDFDSASKEVASISIDSAPHPLRERKKE